MDKEKDIRQILSGEKVEVPESLLPENMKKRIMQMEKEGSFNADRRVRKKGHTIMPYVRAGAAVAAGLIICVLSGSVGGINTFMPGTMSGIESSGNVKNASEQDYDGYYLAYQSLHTLEQTWKSEEKESGGIWETIINGLPFVSKNKPKNFSASGSAGTNSASAVQLQEDVRLYENADVDSIASEDGFGDTEVSAQKSETSKSFSDTNVRTQGVNEGDIVKTDGDYIYEYVSGSDVCNIYQVDDAVTKCVAKIRKEDFGGFSNKMNLTDMYVAGDRLILLAGIHSPSEKQIKKIYKLAGADYSNFNEESWIGYESYGDVYWEEEVEAVAEGSKKKDKLQRYVTYTLTYIFDISDRSQPTLQRMTFQDGDYTSSRMVGDILYLFSQRTISMENMKEDKPETYIPQINGRCVAKGCVSVPKDVQTTNYSIVSSLDVQTGEDIDEKSVLGGASEVYVSGSNIYMLDESASYDNKNGRTVITKFAYEDGKITGKATGEVKGFVDDDYALDEYKGYLRVVSTYYGRGYQERNAVYVLDEDLNVTGSVKNIAKNEEIYSARFMGDIAYFVTYRETDPLFTADLSDPKNPKIIGELKLPGFSDYLHPIGDHLLLGLGQDGDEDGNFQGLKLALYDISDPVNVKEIHKEVLPDSFWYAEALQNPNALFLDEERGLLGFYMEGYNEDTYYEEVSDYVVYSYSEKKGFKKKLDVTLQEGDELEIYRMAVRGLYIDDFFYIVSVGQNKIISYDYRSFEHLKTNRDE